MLNNTSLFLGFGLGTMLISEGARLKGSRFSNSLYAYAIFDEGYVLLYLYMLLSHCSYYLEVASLMFVLYISVTNSTCQLRKLLS